YVNFVNQYPRPVVEVWVAHGSDWSSGRKSMELVPGNCSGPLGKALYCSGEL
ncbi:hypothetical protein NDU88_002784, partial [Pleurodeles waltl]